MSDDTIRHHRIVTLRCQLRAVDGEPVDEPAPAPIEYLHGHGNLLPAIEAALEGAAAGASITLSLAPAQAYGERHDEAVVQVPRTALDPAVEPRPGARVEAEGPHGRVPFTLLAVDETTATLDANHPLAGRQLDYALQVLAVRDAHPDEIRHHRPHPGGHHLMVSDSSWRPE